MLLKVVVLVIKNFKTIEDSQGTVNQTFKDSESGSERFKVAMNKLKLVGADVWTSIESAFASVMEELIKSYL